MLLSCNNKKQRHSNTTPASKSVKNTIIYNNTKIRALESYFSKLSKQKVFNGNVLFAQKGKIIFEKAYGYAEYKTRDSLTTKSVFQLGSVSKQFTAVAILQLYEQGKIDLQDSIQRFFPDFPYKGITIHQLLCHRSGLMNYIYFCDNVWANKTIPLQNSSVIQLLTDSFPPRYYPPNKKFDYSNTGYMMLASVVEKVSGQAFRTYMKEHIFEPLGMKDSYIYNHQYPYTHPNLVKGYEYRNIIALPDFLDGTVGDKGVYSTIYDLWLWDKGLYDNIIIKKETLDLAFQPHGKKKQVHTNYGYGWRMFYTPDSTKVLYHAGWWHGFKSLIMRIEEDTSTVVVLKNKSNRLTLDKTYMLEVLNIGN